MIEQSFLTNCDKKSNFGVRREFRGLTNPSFIGNNLCPFWFIMLLLTLSWRTFFNSVSGRFSNHTRKDPPPPSIKFSLQKFSSPHRILPLENNTTHPAENPPPPKKKSYVSYVLITNTICGKLCNILPFPQGLFGVIHKGIPFGFFYYAESSGLKQVEILRCPV